MVSQLLGSGSSFFWGGVSSPQSLATGDRSALEQGQVLVTTRSYGFTGGQAQARLLYRLSPEHLWPQVIDYPRWVTYFPDLVSSAAIAPTPQGQPRIYQVGRKSVLGLDFSMELHLRVKFPAPHRVEFTLERGTLADFNASFALTPWPGGTLLTFTLAAVPLLPLPSIVVEHSLQRELPFNLEQMRRVVGGQP